MDTSNQPANEMDLDEDLVTDKKEDQKDPTIDEKESVEQSVLSDDNYHENEDSNNLESSHENISATSTDNNNEDDSIKTRKSSRTSVVKNTKSPTSEAKQSTPKKGIKRKSVPGTESSPNKFKIPIYEHQPVELLTKTIIISENMSQNYIMDRSKLTKIPPKDGATFGVGDLVWAKMQGYPWWPCMITIDPTTGIYSKTAGTSYKANTVYHVQYFGNQPYRGWTQIGMVMPFQGYQDFVDKIQNDLKDLDPKKRSKIEAKYVVKNSIQKNWNESISEAEEAMNLSLEERVQLLTFNYAVTGGGQATPNRAPRLSSGGKSSSRKSPHKNLKKSADDVYDFDEDEDDAFGEDPLPEFVFRKRDAKGDFDVYLKKHYDEEAKKNPELKKVAIINILKEKWEELDEPLRAIYAERKAIYEDESKMLVSKRSNFGDDYSNESDSDYNDSDVFERNGLIPGSQSESDSKDGKYSVTDSTPVASKPIKSRKSKSKKSEKLFDQIKNNDTINSMNDGDDIKNDQKKSVKKIKKEKPATPKTSKPKSRTKKSDLKNSGNSGSFKNDDNLTSYDIMITTTNQEKNQMLIESKTTEFITMPSQKDVLVHNDDEDEVEIKYEVDVKDEVEVEVKDEVEVKAEVEVKNEDDLSGSDDKNDLHKKSEQKNTNSTASSSNNNNGLEDDDDSKPSLANLESEYDSSASENLINNINVKSNVRPQFGEEQFCFQCSDEEKKNDTLVACTGPCGRRYHLTCTADTKMLLIDGKNICEECYTGKHPCFCCKNPVDTQKCADAKCQYYYHLDCLQNFPIRVMDEKAKKFICPLHQCVNCHLLSLDDNGFRKNNRKLLRCIRCPIAYHAKSVCIGAGTVQLSNEHIICPDHFGQSLAKNEIEKLERKNPVNVDYCFACVKVGNLICCETCPAAFHEKCLDHVDHNGRFYCSNCSMRKPLHYGEIVWVKLSQYRWWPGRICDLPSVPENVLRIKHQIGDFPVYFFGTNDYAWTNKGRAFLFQEEDKYIKAKCNGRKTKLNKSYKSALREAAAAFDVWQKTSALNSLQTINKKPPRYQQITSNRYFSKKVNENSEFNAHVCDCKPNTERPCSDDGCLNRISLIECDPKECPAGEKCMNQRFCKCEYVQCEPFRGGIAGWGLKTLQDIKKEDFVIEYCGEIIDEKECNKRLEKNMNGNCYFLTIDKDTIIDAGPKGNLSRFMNHSCDPNCVTQKWMVNNTIRVGIFALKDIPKGSELTFNYNLDSRGNEQVECKCNAPQCSGYIGVRPGKTVETNNNNNNNNQQQSRKRKNFPNPVQNKRLSNGSTSITSATNKMSKKTNYKRSTDTISNTNNNKKQKAQNTGNNGDHEMHEDVCFKCGEKNNLIQCNEQACKKSYHFDCIHGLNPEPDNIDDMDMKKWICPRHKCMRKQCNESAYLFCSVCPNSLCREHASTMSNNLRLPDQQFLCGDHRDNSDDEGLIEETIEHNGNDDSEEDEESDFDTSAIFGTI